MKKTESEFLLIFLGWRFLILSQIRIQYPGSVSERQCRPPAGAPLISWQGDTGYHWSRSHQDHSHWSPLFTSVRVPLVAYYSEFILIQRPA